MNWLMRLVGAPADLSQRAQWANEHPARSSAVGAFLVVGFLDALLLLRTGQVLIPLLFFAAAFTFMFVLSYTGIKLRGRHSAPPASTAAPDAAHPPRQLWFGRRRWIPLTMVPVAYFAFEVVATPGVTARVFYGVVVICGLANSYRYWADPTPAQYLQRQAWLKSQPRFGTKLWHKVAAGFLGIVAVSFVAGAVLVRI